MDDYYERVRNAFNIQIIQACRNFEQLQPYIDLLSSSLPPHYEREEINGKIDCIKKTRDIDLIKKVLIEIKIILDT